MPRQPLFQHRSCCCRRTARRACWQQSFLPLLAFACLLLPLAGCSISFGTSSNTNTQGITEHVNVVQGQDNSTLVLLPVTIHGKGPFTFALDTGASTSLIAASLAQRLGLQPTGNSQPITGIGGVEQAVFVKVSNWNTGPIKLPSVSIASAAIPHSEGSNLQGLLGSDIWSRFGKFTLDYSAGTLTVYKQIAFAPADFRHLPVTFLW